MKKSSQPGRPKATEWRTISYTRAGKAEQVDVEAPANVDANHDREATQFVQTLEDNQQITHDPGPLAPGTTHQIETDQQGKKRLVRKRFSAI